MTSLQERNSAVIAEFRANGGRVAQFEGVELVILHHVGARSGEERATPLACLLDGDAIVVFGSNGGGATHPHWYHNIRHEPHVIVEAPDRSFRAVARVATGPERTRLWDRQRAVMPVFDTYEAKTAGTREIPVVVLEPTSEP